jgi:TRAP-type mannitol/chloroaromatic compound transport system substrate-binding protein
MRATTALTLAGGIVIGVALGAALFRTTPEQEAPPAATGAETAAPAAPAGSGAPSVQWKLAGMFARTLPLTGTQGVRFVERLAEVSDGDIVLKYYEPGALVPGLEIFDAVSSGAVDAGWSSAGFWAGKVPALQFFTSVPFGPEPGEFLAWMMYGGGRELYEELYRPHDIHPLICNMTSPEGSGWFREPIESVDQLKGLKMRFFGLGAKVMEKLGVSTQLIAPGDIFPALELGTIDAAEFAMPVMDEALGLDQVAQHYYFPGWHQPTSLGELIVNMDRWTALDAHQKALIEMACRESTLRGLAEGEALQGPALQELERRGVTLHHWPPEMIAAFRSAWAEVAAEQAAADKDFARVWTSLTDFRETYKLWGEYGYLR